jgi:UDP-GlcNAc:undecaprenyl-phosphate GlcNAc-1-phosphate transferase
VLVLAIASSFVLTAIARRLAVKIGMLDRPDGLRKSHTKPMPMMGGVALYLAFALTVAVARWAKFSWLNWDEEAGRLVTMLFVSAGLFCLIGLYDDRKSIRPRVKLLLQILATLPFIVWGRSVDSIHLLGMNVHLGIFGTAFTIFWLVACTNIINLVDGLDGLAGTIGLIVCLAVAQLSAMQGLLGATALALIFSGCLLGFLLHNWPPAKIFLGDSGSLMIGFVMGALSIESSLKTTTTFTLAVPLVLVSVPIFDTLMAIIRRKLNGKGIGEADRGHIHHCLQNRGLTQAQSLSAIAALCVAMAAVTLVSAYIESDLMALGLCVLLLLFLIVGRVFGYSETLQFFRFMQAISLMLVDTSGVFRTRLFLARINTGDAEPERDYWDDVTRHVQEMGCFELDFIYADEGKEKVHSTMNWRDDQATVTDGPVWKFSYSVPNSSGECATLIASGQSRRKLHRQRLIDLFRVFDTFCQFRMRQQAAAQAEKTSPPAPIISLPTWHSQEKSQYSESSENVADSSGENRKVA